MLVHFNVTPHQISPPPLQPCWKASEKNPPSCMDMKSGGLYLIEYNYYVLSITL